jgi:hypothetical protein
METLGRRTVELAVTNRQLQRGIVRRKSVEAALKKSGEHYARLLKEFPATAGRLAATDAPGAGGAGG